MPARLAAIRRALKDYNVVVEAPPGGSHYKARGSQGTYSLPAHNGLKSEISDVYVKGLCRFFDIPYEDLVEKL